MNDIKTKLQEFKRKFYAKELINGIILFFAILLIAFLSVVTLEYLGNFNSTARKVLFFSFIAIAGFALVKHIFIPIKNLLNTDKILSDQQAATEVGLYFPEIKDKLLNTLQLSSLNFSDHSLVQASIDQKTEELKPFSFQQAINFDESKKYLLTYLLLPLLLIGGLLIFNRETITKGTERIVKFNQEFVPEAPFKFELQNTVLSAFRGDDFSIKIKLKGDSIPDQVYLVSKHGRQLMSTENGNDFDYTFYNIQEEVNFWFESSGFSSSNHLIKLKYHPAIQNIKVALDYPQYLGKKSETNENIGNIVVPEGTIVDWSIISEETNTINFVFNNSEKYLAERQTENRFEFKKEIKENSKYSIELKNKFGKNKEEITYRLEVIKDKYPGVNLEHYTDTIFYSYLLIGGNVFDDYGIRNLKLFYKIIDKQNDPITNYKSISIPFNKNQTTQNFVYQLSLDTFQLQAGQQIDYYVQVWDNDGVNGSKSSKSKAMSFRLPTKDEFQEKQNTQSEANKSQLSEAMSKSEKINEELKRLSEEMKTKRELSWQDKKDMEKALQKHRQLQSEIQSLNEQMQTTAEQQKQFDEQNPALQEKMQQLQELMQQMLDPETQKLMDELQKLLNDEQSIDEINKKLDELNKKEESFEKELDRALEMYKQLEFENKLDNSLEKLEELSQKQEELQKQTENANSKEELEQIQKEQDALNKEFDKVQEELQELEKLNEELENKKDFDALEEDQKDIEENMENSSEQLGDNKKKNAAQSQKNAAEKMKKMTEKMAEMKESGETIQLEENIEDLKQILDNLIKLSFNQEEVTEKLSGLSQKNPLFIDYSQKQLDIERDSKILEDSLYALAKRMFQLQAVITKEVSSMKNYLSESTELIKQRNPSKARVKQQYAMTSMNNLALLLDDVLDNLQSEMSQKSDGDQMCEKPGNSKGNGKGKPKPGMGDMQKEINKMIKQLKNGQKQGKSMSSELAKMAAKQEMLRRGLKDLQESGTDGKENQQMKEELKKLEEAMKQTEDDLLNNNLTEKTINRQQDILTRLLESENASREREYNNKRKATKAQDLVRELPPDYDKYLKLKQKQIELLQTIPPNLTPYYKQEVNEYFNTIEK